MFSGHTVIDKKSELIKQQFISNTGGEDDRSVEIVLAGWVDDLWHG
jgi:hypothetical protein